MQAAGQQIAEIDHRVDALPRDVFEDGVERRDVAVNIGNESYPHNHRIAAWVQDCNTADRRRVLETSPSRTRRRWVVSP
ncbi:hypothetical protein NY08_4988 [Rhodococcus sp. B7740]|nr:hypothetical protein NY08_4988 [Rhodococcus sp. B7740]